MDSEQWTVEVELRGDETLLDRGYFSRRARWWHWPQGILYLTSQRLIWKRRALSLPLGPEMVEIALVHVVSCDKRRTPLSILHALAVRAADGRTHWFSPVLFLEHAAPWCEAISKAVTEAEAP